MGTYKINLENYTCQPAKDFRFKTEGSDILSPQVILSKNPEILVELRDLGISNTEVVFCTREFSTLRGSIDILLIMKSAEIVIIETKLIRNPESSRTVVAQAIDYVKALSSDDSDDILTKIQAKSASQPIEKLLKDDETFQMLLSKNFKTGSFSVLIVGDYIHPKVLGVIESIQSAPHLGFTIYLVELNAATVDDGTLVLMPKIVANTVEIERSVVKIEIIGANGKYRIDSEVPSKEGKGSRPILSWNQYLDSITKVEFKKVIEQFREKWINEIGASISMGQVGFSAGVSYGSKRIPIQYIYNNRIALLSQLYSERLNIPPQFYKEYKDALKASKGIFDEYLVGNKVEIPFDRMDVDSLNTILGASFNLAMSIKNS